MTKIIACVLAIILSVVAVVFVTKDEEKRKEAIITSVTKIAENAYFEGQKDAIEGDIRIRKTDAGYEWAKSPWDEEMSYNEGEEQMKELTITKKYLVFNNTDFMEASKYLDEEAFFGNTEEELKEQIASGEANELTSITITKSYGVQFENCYDSNYNFMAVLKPEETTTKKGK